MMSKLARIIAILAATVGGLACSEDFDPDDCWGDACDRQRSSSAGEVAAWPPPPEYQLLAESETIRNGAGGVRGVAARKGRVYIPYADASYQIRVAEYNTKTQAWIYSQPLLPSIAEYDPAHEDMKVAVDGRGHIHLWAGMHHHPMRYRRSASPYSISSWLDNDMLGVATGVYTYPEPAVCPRTGDVFHFTRRGLEHCDLFHWQTAKQKWRRVATVFSGAVADGQEGDAWYRCYNGGIAVDSMGDVHITARWHRGHQRHSRHQGTYIRFDPRADAFYKANGTEVTGALPITTLHRDDVWQFAPRVVDWDEHEIDTDSRVAVNAADQPVIGYNYSPVAGDLDYQYRVSTWTGTRWQRTTLPARSGTFSQQTWVSQTRGLLRAHVRDTATGHVKVFRSLYGGTLWDGGTQASPGRLTSVSGLDDDSDVVLDSIGNPTYPTRLYRVDFSLPPAPSRVELFPEADALVRGGAFADTPFGLEKGATVKNSGDPQWSRTSYFRFSLASTGLKRVRHARLKAFCNSKSGDNLAVSAYQVAEQPWAEGTITWNNAPALGARLATRRIGATDVAYTWDVSKAVNAALASGEAVTIALHASDVGSSGATFSTREHGANQPVLELVDWPASRAVEQEFAPSQDAMVRGGSYATQNFGRVSTLLVKKADGADSHSRKAYLKFDLRSLPRTNVGHAVLKVYNRSLQGTAPTVVTAYTAGNGWNEDTITWKNAPTLGPGIDAVSVKDTRDYVAFDVTPLVAERLAVDKIVTVVLYRSGKPSPSSVDFQSREGGKAPTLTVTCTD